MAESEKKHGKLKEIVDKSRYWDVEDLLRNIDHEMQRMEQGLSHTIWDMNNRPVTQCPFPLPATPRFETSETDTEFKLKVRLPDVPKDKIELRIDSRSIEVYGGPPEKTSRPFYISVDSSSELDPQNVKTKHEEDALEVTVKKIKKTRVRVQ